MNLVELLQSESYRSIFNYIFKKYLSNKSNESVTFIDISMRAAVDELVKLKCQQKEQDINKSIYLLETENDEIDVCIHEELEDEIQSIEFYNWSDISCMTIKQGSKLTNKQICGEVLWQMTSWGDSNHSIQKVIQDIKSTVKMLT